MKRGEFEEYKLLLALRKLKQENDLLKNKDNNVRKYFILEFNINLEAFIVISNFNSFIDAKRYKDKYQKISNFWYLVCECACLHDIFEEKSK
jgi:hypothetical protein